MWLYHVLEVNKMRLGESLYRLLCHHYSILEFFLIKLYF